MNDLAQVVGRLVGQDVVGIEYLAGGNIAQAARVTLSDRSTLVAKSSPVAAREARMLTAMRNLDVPVPTVLAQEGVVLVLEDLGPGESMNASHWQSVPLALAPLRRTTATHYGWHEDYRLAEVDVPNSPSESWVEFWRDHRLLCHVEHLPNNLARRAEVLAADLVNRIPDRPPVALVHGDLWGGNIVAGRTGEIWLIDPCAYYGDREVDVAAITVFDNPPDGMFGSLDLDAGWQERLPIYRLWMWLVHIRLFGEGYRPAAEADISRLGV